MKLNLLYDNKSDIYLNIIHNEIKTEEQSYSTGNITCWLGVGGLGIDMLTGMRWDHPNGTRRHQILNCSSSKWYANMKAKKIISNLRQRSNCTPNEN